MHKLNDARHGPVTISHEDYLAISARSPWRFLMHAGKLGVIVAICVAATFGTGYYAGKSSRQMTLEHALRVLDQEDPREWSHLAALGAVYRATDQSLSAMREWTTDPATPGQDAAIYIRYIALECASIMLSESGDGSPHAEAHRKSIEALKKALP
jgi:hypothetical protein